MGDVPSLYMVVRGALCWHRLRMFAYFRTASATLAQHEAISKSQDTYVLCLRPVKSQQTGVEHHPGSGEHFKWRY